MRIMGIDPGLAIVGFGIIDLDVRKVKVVDYGTIQTDNSLCYTDRLLCVGNSLEKILKIYQPDVVAIEELFFNKNSKTAFAISQVRGVIIYTVLKKEIPLYEYTPLQVKQGVVGYGRATKNQVQLMVKNLLNLKEIPKPDDAADGLAVALCHKNFLRSNGINLQGVVK
ncbi:Holliday junction endonuclease RuvC [Anaerobranca californiensis DSM 14826]|jgi:crossover junction endodeoxyribonuclease RuvC|uniref:Crossover junction endodeoxyribonuclease RuvC n=1 Tax=Anaerobranca californiensis DSM 14826 TaxID=1120989 RepID=A0A1M6LPP2_9FIRM|nr:crossover junction endodeoxyribonuclease RuvC [Anaerobranca californiensis]SHJ73166.1 Holliday junction endonuclease RuvC [Anaerobranca californiensis DSM 14826]